MNKVYKYAVKGDPFEVPSPAELPLGAEVIDAGFEGSQLVVWAVVNPGQRAVSPRLFRVYGTGWGMDANVSHTHLKTFVNAYDGAESPLVWHVFEVDEGHGA